MKYRKYCNQINIGAFFILSLGLSACASTNNNQDVDREPSSVESAHERDIDRPGKFVRNSLRTLSGRDLQAH